jgi:predicted ribosomally synthesized peptide with nif11-like leader
MNPDLTRFYSATLNSPELMAGLNPLRTAEEIVEFAKQSGFQFSADDLKHWTLRQTAELTDRQLAAVVGGATTMTDSLAAGCSFWEAWYYHTVLKS